MPSDRETVDHDAGDLEAGPPERPAAHRQLPRRRRNREAAFAFALWLIGSFMVLALIEQFYRFPRDWLAPPAVALAAALRTFRKGPPGPAEMV